MNAETKIRKILRDLDIYPVGVINACRIYKSREGWQIEKFGEVPWTAGRNLAEVLENLRELAAEKKADH